jgi:hypothetical protein
MANQSTLTAFSQPSEELQNCTTCHVVHTIIGDRCRCVFLGKGQPIPAWCRDWWPADPLRFWPKLAPNYEAPKKWGCGV